MALLGGAAATWTLSVRGQQSDRVARIGLLHSGTPSEFTDDAFRLGLREAGFIDGQNALIEHRWARGSYQRLAEMAAELLNLRVNLMAAFGTPATHAAKSASIKSDPAIPVVFTMGGDPVAEGFVQSLNRPGGNVTGLTSISGALASKRLELLREFLRSDAPVAILLNPTNPLSGAERRDAETAAHAIGQRIEVLTASNPAEIDGAFAQLVAQKVSILIIAVDQFYFSQVQRLATLAGRTRLPVIGPLREFAMEGGLLSYGPNLADVSRRAGILAGRILKGAKPAELPVEQPTKFELVVNLRTAKVLSIELPQTLLALADEVIE
jgi:putative ABC transport system substrate-binding protein